MLEQRLWRSNEIMPGWLINQRILGSILMLLRLSIDTSIVLCGNASYNSSLLSSFQLNVTFTPYNSFLILCFLSQTFCLYTAFMILFMYCDVSVSVQLIQSIPLRFTKVPNFSFRLLHSIHFYADLIHCPINFEHSFISLISKYLNPYFFYIALSMCCIYKINYGNK